MYGRARRMRKVSGERIDVAEVGAAVEVQTGARAARSCRRRAEGRSRHGRSGSVGRADCSAAASAAWTAEVAGLETRASCGSGACSARAWRPRSVAATSRRRRGALGQRWCVRSSSSSRRRCPRSTAGPARRALWAQRMRDGAAAAASAEEKEGAHLQAARAAVRAGAVAAGGRRSRRRPSRHLRRRGARTSRALTTPARRCWKMM